MITALYDDSGELQGFAKVTRNLTERKENEDSLRSANSILQQQQKELQHLNESKDDFISLASHQLRTPATAIKQLLGILIEGLAGDVPQHILDILKKTYESNERQIAIVNSLLKVAQIDSGKIVLRKQLIDLNKIISSVSDQYAGVVSEKNQSIVLSLNDKPVYGCVDEGYYRMLLENILDNASKYTSGGGLITVASYVENNFAVVTVADNGVGIKPENISTLFDKFNRIPNDMAHKVAGSGLGLYWVEKVVDLHQGKIEVESEINVGTKFLISVPREL